MTDLAQLQILAQTRYDQQKRSFALILHEETRLRQELQRISFLGQGSSDASTEMQALGADMLWRGWLSRTKTSLNTELARVLARKAREQDKVRRAFGQLTALTALLEEEQVQRRKKSERNAFSELVLSAAHNGQRD